MRSSYLFFLFVFTFKVYSQASYFKAKGLIYLHDADFGAFSYALDEIKKEANDQDKIGAYILPLTFEASLKNSEKAVSNSMMQNAASAVLHPTKKLCYVAETYKELSKVEAANSIKASSLGAGSYISVIDYSNLSALKGDYRFQVSAKPLCLAFSKDAKYLCIGSEAYNQEIQTYELDDQGKPIRLLPRPSQLANGGISSLVWHPGGEFCAYVNQKAKEVGLLKVVRDNKNDIIRIDLFGNTVKFEGSPSQVLFSPKGDLMYVLDQRTDIFSANLFDKGFVFSIKPNFENGLNHILLSKAEVDVNPVSMRMHSSGQYLLVNNLKKSFDFPINDRNTGKGSISILNLLPDGGILSKNQVSVEGIMPSSMAFDEEGENLVISSFQSMTYGKPTGSIQFFKFNKGPNPNLEKHGVSINTQKGIGGILPIF
jgi:6-phosphogluconolactonase (cycloisomerase 2 family)